MRLDDGGQLLGDAFTILEGDDDQNQVALANGGDAFFLAWRGGRNGSADIYGSLFRYLQAGFSGAPSSGTAPLEVQFTDESTPAGAAYIGAITASFAYAYAAIHRLTGATYTGDIAGSFEYVYDAVGNMTAYTETVDAQTISVTRSFDAANRLQTSIDATAGTTSYIYDANGNLTEVYPPGSDAQNPVGVCTTTMTSGTFWSATRRIRMARPGSYRPNTSTTAPMIACGR